MRAGLRQEGTRSLDLTLTNAELRRRQEQRQPAGIGLHHARRAIRERCLDLPQGGGWLFVLQGLQEAGRQEFSALRDAD